MNLAEYENDAGWQFLRLTKEQMLEEQNKPYDSKKNCWVPDAEEGFVAADILDTAGDKVTVRTVKGQEISVKKDRVQEMNPPKFNLSEDMANLTFLNEASVLWNLRHRYSKLMIYTYSGLFVVVINPYKRLPIYTPTMVAMFNGKRRNEMPPHLFAASDEAYRNMINDRVNQSMLITGESGAGKTENTKKVISYFALVGASQKAADADSKKATLEEQIVQTNPVLEAFGNAKTVRNNNSSRFGKFIRSWFNTAGRLAGGDIEHYLLEKSRVIRQAPGERCYHIFYQMMTRPDVKELCLLSDDITYYHFVSQADLTVPGMDDKEEMSLTQEAMDIMGFEAEEQRNLFQLTAACMHLGEMKFVQHGEQAAPKDEEMTDLKNACTCFTVPANQFENALCKPRVKVGAEWVNKGQTLEQVNWSVGALAKGIYARMFHWLIDRCNVTLDSDKTLKRELFIGVLDIAGFEIFDFNSFEQLWINFVNEKLQQFFNHHMFVLEQEEYQREGITWQFIDFGLDLAACIQLIERPLGIISILDEECIVPKATDTTYAQKLQDQHLGKHASFEKPKPPKGKQAEAHFALAHYAGTVRYNVTNWLEKNKDPLNDSVITVLKKAENNPLLLACWKSFQTQEEAAEAAKSGGGGKRKGKSASMLTVSMMYRESLTSLMNMLNQTHPHFVRCIIPNEVKQSGLLDAALVMHQLTCNGVLEGIRICRKGFPNRIPYKDFRHRYALIAAEAAHVETDIKPICEAVLYKLIDRQKLTHEEFRMGKTKVFFKAGVLARMEELRDVALDKIFVGLQSQVSYYAAMADSLIRERQMFGYTAVQRNIKNWCVLRNWEWYRAYCFVKPHLKCNKIGQEMRELGEKIKDLEQVKVEKEKANVDLQAILDQKNKEKQAMLDILNSGGSNVQERQVVYNQLLETRKAIDKETQALNDRANELEEKGSTLRQAKASTEDEANRLRQQIAQLEKNVEAAGAAAGETETQIVSLQQEMNANDDLIGKLMREKKEQDERNQRIQEDIDACAFKLRSGERTTGKNQWKLDEMLEALEREHRFRTDAEKASRKVNDDIKLVHEEIEGILQDRDKLVNELKKREEDLREMVKRTDGYADETSRLQRQLAELDHRKIELSEETHQERVARARLDKLKAESHRELDELSARIEELSAMTKNQAEQGQKRNHELLRMRNEFDDANSGHETQMAALRKRHNQAVAEMGEQLNQMQTQKLSFDNEVEALHDEINGNRTSLDTNNRTRADAEKQLKLADTQLHELHRTQDEQRRQLHELSGAKSRLSNENADMLKRLEEADRMYKNLERMKSQLVRELEVAKQAADDEAEQRQQISAELKHLEHDNEQLRSAMHDVQDQKNQLKAQISKVNADMQHWKMRYEQEGLARLDELDEAKRRASAQLAQLQEAIEVAAVRLITLEKQKCAMLSELDDTRADVDRSNNYNANLEKELKRTEAEIDAWRQRYDAASLELENTQRESRELSTKLFKMKTNAETLQEKLESARRDNKQLAEEVKALSDQLGEDGRRSHELQKFLRSLELEKEDLQVALDEAETAVAAAQSNYHRAQLEMHQIRQEIDKRMQEKEEEFENIRKQHQRDLDDVSAQLETEVREKQEAMRVRKKLELDVNELEVSLDHANKSNLDAQVNIKQYLDQIKQLQSTIDDEYRVKQNLSEKLTMGERQCTGMEQDKDTLLNALGESERRKRIADAQLGESRVAAREAARNVDVLSAGKRQLEALLIKLHAELEDCLSELRTLDDKYRMSAADASRLAEELRQEQEHSQHEERQRKGMEQQVKEMQIRLDEAEAAALQGGKAIIKKLEIRCKDLESEYSGEQRRHQETEKTKLKHERRIKELEFQITENQKNRLLMEEMADQLQRKLSTYKHSIDEAEETAAVHLGKYRQLMAQFESAEERADMAENSVNKLRVRGRSMLTAAAIFDTTGQAPVGRSAVKQHECRPPARGVNESEPQIHVKSHL